jgi:hypothetical protein
MAKNNKKQIIQDIKLANFGTHKRQKDAFNTAMENAFDSVYHTEVIEIQAVSESARVDGQRDFPANTLITDITAVCTSTITLDSAFLGLNIGTASLHINGFNKANIHKQQHRIFLATAGGTLAAGSGSSTVGTTSDLLGSAVTMSLQRGNIYYENPVTIHCQLSSSAVDKGFKTSTGKMAVAITYKTMQSGV